MNLLRFFFLLLCSLPAHALVDAMLDRNRIAYGDSVTLTLQRDGNSSTQPNLAPLQKDFAILARSRGTSVQIVEGRLSAQTQVQLVLSPRHGGRITIPPLAWDQERSAPLALEVVGGVDVSAATGPHSHIYLSASLAQGKPYELAAIPLKLRLYTDEPLYQATLTLNAGNDVLVRQIGQDSERSETRDGRNYRVVERDYLLFPQKSGRLRLEGAVLDAQVASNRNDDPFAQAFAQIFGGMPGGSLRPVRIQGEPIILDVLPRPAGIAPQDWLPARQVRLEETWSDQAMHANVPVTRQLRLTALGLAAAQLPDLAARMPLPPGIKAYPDPAVVADTQKDGSIEGRREQGIALIALQPGRYEIPEMRVGWWDTEQHQMRVAVLPARTLEVLPGAAPAPVMPQAPFVPAAPVAPAADAPEVTGGVAGFWPWLSLALALLTIIAIAWGIRRGRPARPLPPTPETTSAPRASAARRAFHQACQRNDAAAARQHLIDWAAATWPEAPPAGLNALARQLDDTAAAEVRALDRACYVGEAWRGTALHDALRELPVHDKTATDDAGPAGLYS